MKIDLDLIESFLKKDQRDEFVDFMLKSIDDIVLDDNIAKLVDKIKNVILIPVCEELTKLGDSIIETKIQRIKKISEELCITPLVAETLLDKWSADMTKAIEKVLNKE